jgi:hypothetical protein
MYLFLWYVRQEHASLVKSLKELEASKTRQKIKATFRKKRIIVLEHEIERLAQEKSYLFDDLQEAIAKKDPI